VDQHTDPKERPAEAENALLLPVQILRGEAALSVRFSEEKGGNFSVPYGMSERAKSADGVISLGAAATPWTLADPGRTLDPQRLRSVQIGGEVKTDRLKFVIKKAAWATF